MAVLFFSMEGDIEQVAHLIFNVLQLDNAAEGDSLNVLNGIYIQAYALGHRIRLEGNSYDYEDDYNYMLSVNENFLVNIKSSHKVAESLADAVAILLKINLGIEIARERGDDLVLL